MPSSELVKRVGQRTLTRDSTLEKKKKFLEAISMTGNISYSAEQAEISRPTHYIWMEKDKQYALDFENAQEIATDKLEAEVWRRGFQGIDKPIYYKGKKVDIIKEYSDLLAMFYLKAKRPKEFREAADIRFPGGLEIKGVPVQVIQQAIIAVKTEKEEKE